MVQAQESVMNKDDLAVAQLLKRVHTEANLDSPFLDNAAKRMKI